MARYDITALTVAGYENKPLANTFYRQAGTPSGLALLLPGLRYTGAMPLLYYAARLLLERHTDVLVLDADYTRPAFQTAQREEQATWMATDAQAALRTGKSLREYPRLVLLGKSIGTLTLTHLLQGSMLSGDLTAQVITIWLTPLLHQPHLVTAALQCKGPSFFACGSADPTYDPATLERICAAACATAFIAPGADHSLEIPGNIIGSLHILEEYLHNLAGLLTRAELEE
jgi:hypothetical protein